MSDQIPPDDPTPVGPVGDPPDDLDGEREGSDAGGLMSAGLIEPIEIQEEMERSFLDYSMSVIVSRALPDARDGLKPVHRRILWGMFDLGARPDTPTMKCARVTGEVMGKYHPHGDGAIYDALVRMGQSFSLRHPLISPKGNFGSPDDPPAASRYTECRLAPIALSMLADIDEDVIDFVDNYSAEFEEPSVLPARFPNLLVNGSQGIAVGMATNIPPHNLGEVVDATHHLLDNPDATPDDLMQFVKGPDFPTGGIILGRQGILDAYRTGRGSIRMRGVAEIEEDGRATKIVISQLPYQVSHNAVITKIKQLVNDRELDGVADLNDESAQGKTRIVVKLKRDAPALVILNNLYKHTPLQTNFAVNTVALVDGIPRTLNLRDVLVAYVEHQVDVIQRRSRFRLDKAQRRAHIVEGLIRALDMIDAIIGAIRGSENRQGAIASLEAEAFGFSNEQASHIVDMRLHQLTRLAADALRAELAELHATIAELEAILNDDAKLRSVIKEELAEVRDKFANERRSIFEIDTGELDIADLIDDEDLVVMMSSAGYIKTVAIDAFRTQGRGGRGVAGAKLKDDDYITDIIHTSAHAELLFFTNQGRVYRRHAYEIPSMERTARGTAIVNLLQLQPQESVQTIIDTRDYESHHYLLFATRDGQVKKTRFTEYSNIRANGLLAIGLREGDELVRVIPMSDGEDIILVSEAGQGMRFSESNVRAMGRTAAGVRGMRLRVGDQVVGADVVRPDAQLLTVTDGGYGKRTDLELFATKGRGGMGMRAMKIREGRGRLVSGFLVGTDDEIFVIASSGVVIRVNVADISQQGRDATGVRVMNVGADEKVAAVARVLGVEDDDLPDGDDLSGGDDLLDGSGGADMVADGGEVRDGPDPTDDGISDARQDADVSDVDVEAGEEGDLDG